MPRNYLNYSGQVSAPFTVLSAFTKNGSAYQFEFDTWRSTTDFNNDMDAYGPLHRSVAAQATFAQTNSALLTSLGSAFLTEMGLAGRGFTLEIVTWLPVARVLTLQAVKNNDRATFVKQAAEYTTFLTANATAFGNLNTAVWTYAKANDPFFERMTAAV